MTVTPPPIPATGSPASRVTVVFPDGREHIWVSNESTLTSWEIGQIVVFRNSRWRVTGRRAEESDALTLTLGPV